MIIHSHHKAIIGILFSQYILFFTSITGGQEHDFTFNSTKDILISNVKCVGTENSLLDCPYSYNNCSDSNDGSHASVQCRGMYVL